MLAMQDLNERIVQLFYSKENIQQLEITRRLAPLYIIKINVDKGYT